MPLDNLCPELVYLQKGNIAYPVVGASAAALATTAQARFSDSMYTPANDLVNATLTAALSTGAQTTITCSALPAPLASGVQISVAGIGNIQTFVTSAAAAAGATSISVTSATVNVAFPIGSRVSNGPQVAMPTADAVVVLQ